MSYSYAQKSELVNALFAGEFESLSKSNELFELVEIIREIGRAARDAIVKIVDERFDERFDERVKEIKSALFSEFNIQRERIFLIASFSFSFLSLIIGLILQSVVPLILGTALILISIIHIFDGYYGRK